MNWVCYCYSIIDRDFETLTRRTHLYCSGRERERTSTTRNGPRSRMMFLMYKRHVYHYCNENYAMSISPSCHVLYHSPPRNIVPLLPTPPPQSRPRLPPLSTAQIQPPRPFANARLPFPLSRAGSHDLCTQGYAEAPRGKPAELSRPGLRRGSLRSGRGSGCAAGATKG
ncbi:hypothetical protein K461DRAFT_90687 [Myriangium duriaei CBS 260.36]|uniref:Uncharacterized protein n=1 Tax=Myriangium duriaei CBS 260.36 TaxID=1168546 RepID=A0A9P4J763_9PEZI|nr:hypothetical protein K461DRAFT_90687 [Myriangium duriaei CBS 260.36]